MSRTSHPSVLKLRLRSQGKMNLENNEQDGIQEDSPSRYTNDDDLLMYSTPVQRGLLKLRERLEDPGLRKNGEDSATISPTLSMLRTTPGNLE